MQTTRPRANLVTTNLLELAPEAAHRHVAHWVESQKLPGYRTNQVVARLWKNPVRNWDEATELSKTLRDLLNSTFPLSRLRLDVQQQSADGTRKYLWRLHDGEAIESVLIPTGSR